MYGWPARPRGSDAESGRGLLVATVPADEWGLTDRRGGTEHDHPGVAGAMWHTSAE